MERNQKDQPLSNYKVDRQTQEDSNLLRIVVQIRILDKIKPNSFNLKIRVPWNRFKEAVHLSYFFLDTKTP